MAYVIDENGKVVDPLATKNAKAGAYQKLSSIISPAKPQAITPTVQTVPMATAPVMSTPTMQIVEPSLSAPSDSTSLLEKQKAALLASANSKYQSSLGTLSAEEAKVPGYYTNVKNQAAQQSDLARQGFNEYAAATGLNSGAGGQAELARRGVLQGALTSADSEMAKQLSNFALQRTQLASGLSQSQSDIEAQMASAELGQYNTDRNRSDNLSNDTYAKNLAQAETLASAGDFSGYKALGYSDENIASLQKAYQLKAALSTYSGGSGTSTNDKLYTKYDGDMYDIYKMNLDDDGQLTEQGKIALQQYASQYTGDFAAQLQTKYGVLPSGVSPTFAPTPTPTATPTNTPASLTAFNSIKTVARRMTGQGKSKDQIADYIADRVESGSITLSQAQEIAVSMGIQL